jgi:hypothetical protein
MEIQRRVLKDGAVRWRVRWRQGGRYRVQTFDRKGHAVTFGAELRRRQQLGTLTEMDMGRVTLADYVVGTWCEAYASQLSPKTWMHYRQLLNKHILPALGPLELRAIRPETIGRWQAERLAAGYGRVSVRYALTLLGAILQRAFENGQIQSNPARAVRKAALPRRTEVRPLAPASVERMRAASSPRDATLIASWRTLASDPVRCWRSSGATSASRRSWSSAPSRLARRRTRRRRLIGRCVCSSRSRSTSENGG